MAGITFVRVSILVRSLAPIVVAVGTCWLTSALILLFDMGKILVTEQFRRLSLRRSVIATVIVVWVDTPPLTFRFDLPIRSSLFGGKLVTRVVALVIICVLLVRPVISLDTMPPSQTPTVPRTVIRGSD